jgi:hypothetical protein
MMMLKARGADAISDSRVEAVTPVVGSMSAKASSVG